MSEPLATWFDGRSAKAIRCRVRFEGESLCVDALDGSPLARAKVEAVALGAPGRAPTRRIALPDGSALEVDNVPGLAALLAVHGLRPRATERLETSWRAIGVALLVTLVFTAGAWRFGIPFAARLIADRVPATWEARLGAASNAMLDAPPFRPSALPDARRRQIDARFRELVGTAPGAAGYTLTFRRFGGGANAFALPGGTIVLTDELVAKAASAGGDDAILGVLAHELGHVRERHVLRHIVEASLASGLLGVIIGDFSSVLAIVPATLLRLSYSRAHETSADLFAIDLLRARGIPTAAMADLLEAMATPGHDRAPGADASSADPSPDDAGLLSTHPATRERIARLRATAG
ncbi:MAG: M48 family metallopeptidase [Lautropia sp.]